MRPTPSSPPPNRASGSRTCSKPSSPASRPRKGKIDAPLTASLVDSWYDPYLGVVILVRVIDGKLTKGLNIRFMQGGNATSCRPRRLLHAETHRPWRAWPRRNRLHHRPDQGGGAGPRRRHHHHREKRRDRGAAGLQGSAAGGVSAGCSRWTLRTSRNCAESIGKLRLNDASFSYEMESSAALGFWLSAAGSLACSTFEIIQERLSREYDLDLITTAPSVVYRDSPWPHQVWRTPRSSTSTTPPLARRQPESR